jgi:hypothetical protein
LPEPETDPELAVILAVPAEIADATPLAPIVATEGAEELQVTDDVRSWDEPSEKLPLAV